MDEGLLAFMEKVSSPQKVSFKNSFIYCYVEEGIRQAIILKLVRLISGLRATRLLAEQGFVQEQASLQRILDEITESIEFLHYAVTFKDITDLHREYLKAFYEKIDMESLSSRPMVPRKKLRRYIAKMDKFLSQATSRPIVGEDKNSGEGNVPSRMLTKTYSDYLHAAAPAVMDLYSGKTFHTNGVVGTPRHEEHILDFMHVFYRGKGTFLLATLAFEEESVRKEIRKTSTPFKELYFRHFPEVRP